MLYVDGYWGGEVHYIEEEPLSQLPIKTEAEHEAG